MSELKTVRGSSISFRIQGSPYGQITPHLQWIPDLGGGPRSLAAYIPKVSAISLPSSTMTTRLLDVKIIDFDSLRRRVREAARLSQGWDTYDAQPISYAAIKNAIDLLNLLEAKRIIPSAVLPTCDDSVLIRYKMAHQTIEWELFSNGDNVRVQIEPNGDKKYIEVAAREIPQSL